MLTKLVLIPLRTIALLLTLLLLPATSGRAAQDDALRVPAFTAYIEPNPEALDVSESRGITGWTDNKNRIVWYGTLRSTGRLELALALRLSPSGRSTLRLTVDNTPLTAEAQGTVNGEPVTVRFGSAEITRPGPYRFVLEGVAKRTPTYGEPQALLLSGPASVNAHFNLKERRNAASVHLGYPIPENAKVTFFYNEVTVRTDPLWSYYMACGFRRGYFGIQVNSPTERRIIFSVWDSGTEAVDRSKVSAEDKVQLVEKGPGVVAEGFGNEGTGGHSHLVYPWKKGVTYRFLVYAKPEGTHTVYSGYFYFPERQEWGLIASFRAPKDGGTLKGLYSFNEDFSGANGQLRRLAEFGNQVVGDSAAGPWTLLNVARFTHDPTGKEDRLDYGAGVTHDRFYLSNGGFNLSGGDSKPIHYGDTLTRSLSMHPPRDLGPLLERLGASK